MDFNAWSNSTAVENRLVGKAIFGLVVKHIGFAHIRPLHAVLILENAFKVGFTSWSNLTAVEYHLVGKTIFSLVVNHTGFANIRP